MEAEIYRRFFEIEKMERSRGSRKITATLSTEYPAQMASGYREILEHTSEAIDLSRAPLPGLDSHKHDQTPQFRADDLRIVDRKLKGTLTFGQGQRATELWQDIQDGILRHLSISYIVKKRTKPNADGIYHVTRWQPLEVSVVSIPADPQAVIGRAFTENKHQSAVMERLEKKMKQYNKTFDPEKLDKVDRLFNNIDWRSFGEFAQAVAHAGKNNDINELIDKRLQIARATGMNEAILSEGGHLTPPGFSDKILFSQWASPLIKKLLSLHIEQNFVTLPYATSYDRQNGLSDGVLIYQVEEAGEATTSFPQFAAIQPSLHKTVILCKATDEILADVNVLERFLFFMLSKNVTWDLEDQLINGPGHNSWLGILNSGAKIRVSKQTGQDASTVLSQNVLDMEARALPESQNGDSLVYIVNQTALPEVQKLTVATGTGGGSLSLYQFKRDGEEFDRLCGHPVIVSEHCPILGQEGDIILTDLQYYLFTQRSIRKEISFHLFFTEDISAFKLVLRSDGQPILSKPIMPKNGGVTCSSIVTLETRS